MNRHLKKNTILSKKKEVNKFFADAKKKYGRKINLYYQPVKEGNEKVAFFVSKRSGNACERNLSKRLFREYYRNHKNKFKLFSVIFLIREKFQYLGEVDKELSVLKLYEKNTDHIN